MYDAPEAWAGYRVALGATPMPGGQEGEGADACALPMAGTARRFARAYNHRDVRMALSGGRRRALWRDEPIQRRGA